MGSTDFHLDHVIVAVRDLDRAIQDYRDLGFTVLPGGVHANGATRNALIAFEDGAYIELLARTGAPPAPGLVDFSALLHGREGLVGYALRTDNIEGDWARLKAAGVRAGDISRGERRREDGVRVQWQLMLVEGGFSPFFIQDVTPHDFRVPADAASTSHANHAVGLEGVEIAAQFTAVAAERYGKLLGLPETPRRLSEGAELRLGTGALFFAEAATHPAGKAAAPGGEDEALSALRIAFGAAHPLGFAPDKTHGAHIVPTTR